MEKEVSGLYLSGHPLDAYREQIEQDLHLHDRRSSAGRKPSNFDNQHVTILCTVVKNKVMTTRSNTLMAFTTIEDLTGTMEMLVFPKVFAECRALSAGERGRCDQRPRFATRRTRAPACCVEGVRPIDGYDPEHTFGENRAAALEQAQQVPKKVTSLWLHGAVHAEQGDCTRWKTCCAIFLTAQLPVYIQFEDTGQRMRAPQSMWALDHPLSARGTGADSGKRPCKMSRLQNKSMTFARIVHNLILPCCGIMRL